MIGKCRNINLYKYMKGCQSILTTITLSILYERQRLCVDCFYFVNVGRDCVQLHSYQKKGILFDPFRTNLVQRKKHSHGNVLK